MDVVVYVYRCGASVSLWVVLLVPIVRYLA